MRQINSTVKDIEVQQHTIAQSIVLHLLPGLLFLPVFLIAVKFTDSLGLPKYLAPILISFGLVIMPFELGLPALRREEVKRQVLATRRRRWTE